MCGAASPSLSVWCCFEIYKSLLDVGTTTARKTYDVYTAVPKTGAVGITDGIVANDANAAAKQKRESLFPLERVRLDIKLQLAESSVESDRKSILNDICEQDAEAEPPMQHAKYDMMNGMLAGRFAAGILRVVIARGKPLVPYLNALQQSRLSTLILDLSNLIKFTDKELKLLTAALPSEVEELTINLEKSKASEEGVAALVKHVVKFPKLRRFHSDSFTPKHAKLLQSAKLLQNVPEAAFPEAASIVKDLEALATWE